MDLKAILAKIGEAPILKKASGSGDIPPFSFSFYAPFIFPTPLRTMSIKLGEKNKNF